MFKGIADLKSCSSFAYFPHVIHITFFFFSGRHEDNLEDGFQCLYYNAWGLKLSSFKNIPKVYNFFTIFLVRSFTWGNFTEVATSETFFRVSSIQVNQMKLFTKWFIHKSTLDSMIWLQQLKPAWNESYYCLFFLNCVIYPCEMTSWTRKKLTGYP